MISSGHKRSKYTIKLSEMITFFNLTNMFQTDNFSYSAPHEKLVLFKKVTQKKNQINVF